MRPRERRRRGHYTPDLTSLLDVLFIIVFVSLIRVSSAQQVAAEPAPKPLPPPPLPPAEVAQLRAAALANLTADLAGRTPLVVRVSDEGKITALETAADNRPLDVPLLELSSDPDAAIAYLGDRSAELRVCRIVAVHLGAPDLAKHLVIVAPAVPLAELKRALHRGLHDDLLRCLAEQRGIATIVDPANLPKP